MAQNTVGIFGTFGTWLVPGFTLPRSFSILGHRAMALTAFAVPLTAEEAKAPDVPEPNLGQGCQGCLIPTFLFQLFDVLFCLSDLRAGLGMAA